MENSWALQFKSLTDNGQYAEAKVLLEQVIPQNVAEQRTLGHFRSQLYFYSGEYQKALDCARQTEHDFGSNIRLTGDIAVYLYYLDAGPWYIKALEHFRSEFFKVSQDLTLEALFWSASNLAKMLEEQGDIATSMQIYSDLLKKKLSSERELRTKANLLRCYAICGSRDKVTKLYSEVFFTKNSQSSRFACFEQEHALLLADLYLLGYQGAKKRLDQILSSEQFDPQEKSLSYYDFLDLLILLYPDACNSVSISNELIPLPQLFFEKEVSSYFEMTAKDKTIPLPDLFHLRDSRSPLDVLRILSHGARSKDNDVASFCHMQFSLLLENIPTASQKFWQHRLPTNQQVNLSFDAHQKCLLFRSRRLDLKRSPKQVHLVQLLTTKSSWKTADIALELYGFWDETSVYDRLRMLVKSLNENFKALTGSSLIHLDESRLSVGQEFTLTLQNTQKATVS